MVETMIAVVIISLMMLVALPRIREAFAQSTLRSAQARVVALYSSARAAAVGSNRTATLNITGNQVYVTATPRLTVLAGSTMDTVVQPQNLLTEYGVTVSSGVASIAIAPTGLGQAGTDITLTKGSHADTISINQYGRIVR